MPNHYAIFLCLVIGYCAVGLTGCSATAPPRKILLPPVLNEASGLAVRPGGLLWHNDSGDGPNYYHTDTTGRLLSTYSIPAKASDWEDMTTDPSGRLYFADTGNNRGNRREQAIYGFHPADSSLITTVFTYPGQDGRGRDYPGNYDCEAVVYQGGLLHLFTKDQLFNRGDYWTYHYVVPARPGRFVAELRDSLRLPGRVITAAALDSAKNELVLTSYTFRRSLGFLPNGAASLVTITDFPEGRFLRGKTHRRNLSWFWPTQFEAVDFYDEEWLYVASEATLVRKHAVAKRKRRRSAP